MIKENCYQENKYLSGLNFSNIEVCHLELSRVDLINNMYGELIY
jgi:hypothetical protein